MAFLSPVVWELSRCLCKPDVRTTESILQGVSRHLEIDADKRADAKGGERKLSEN